MTELSDLSRLRAIAAYDLWAPGLAAELDAICRRTAARLGTPVAAVTATLDAANAVIGSAGGKGVVTTGGGVPIEWAFCRHAVALRRPYVVPDTLTRHADNPVVSHEGVRTYAGVPITLPSGHVLGAHCVMGAEPRDFAPDELAELERGAQEVTEVLRHHMVQPA